tara:strand:- start:5492 stop:6604 length:1113 start_codon:yes stop_codon:yes gene_type:complete
MLEHVRGEVSHNTNEVGDGKIMVLIDQIHDYPIPVYMTSPGYQVGGGGVLVMPDTGDQIICLRDTVTSEIFYQTTIIKVDPAPTGTGLLDFEVVPKSLYNKGGKPVKVYYQNSAGAGLEITRNYDVTPNTVIVNSVALKSEKGKRISLDDSPELDAVFVRNQHGDGLTIKGDEDDTLAERITILKSNGSQYYTCFEGQMEFRVVDGRDIVIENNSTGSMSKTPSLDFWPNGAAGQAPKRYGGVYLRSENGDVSISSKALDGRIFIVTPQGRIQITEEGEIQIDADSNIQIRSSGNISLKADGDLKLEGASVDINSTGSLKATGGSEVSISSNGSTNIDGGSVNLNSGASQPAESPNIIDKEDLTINDYNE